MAEKITRPEKPTSFNRFIFLSIKSHFLIFVSTNLADLRTIRILIIDDNPDDRRFVVKEALKLEPCLEIIEADGGLEAISILERHADMGKCYLPQSIILDLKLEGMSGIEFLEKLRTDPRFSFIQVIVFSGLADSHSLKIAFRNNVSGFIVKPGKLEDLRKILKTLLNFWRICEFA